MLQNVLFCQAHLTIMITIESYLCLKEVGVYWFTSYYRPDQTFSNIYIKCQKRCETSPYIYVIYMSATSENVHSDMCEDSD